MRVGETWADMEAELESRAQCLLDAGWVPFSGDREESWEYGDSCSIAVRRGDVELELEYYEHTAFTVFPAGASEDGDPTPPLLHVDTSTVESCRALFEEHGWL